MDLEENRIFNAPEGNDVAQSPKFSITAGTNLEKSQSKGEPSDACAPNRIKDIPDTMMLQDPLRSLAMMAELHAQQSVSKKPKGESAKRKCETLDSPNIPKRLSQPVNNIDCYANSAVQQPAFNKAAGSAGLLITRDAATTSGVTITLNSGTAPVPAFSLDSSLKEKFYARSPEMKVSHKLAERKRRQEINDLFLELRNILPLDPSKTGKTSKWEILSRTIECFEYFKQSNAQLLSERAAHLEKIKQLQQCLSSHNITVLHDDSMSPSSALKRVDSKVSTDEHADLISASLSSSSSCTTLNECPKSKVDGAVMPIISADSLPEPFSA